MGLEEKAWAQPILDLPNQLNGENEAQNHLIKLFEHPLEIKVKYIYRGDGGIGRRNGLKIRR